MKYVSLFLLFVAGAAHAAELPSRSLFFPGSSAPVYATAGALAVPSLPAYNGDTVHNFIYMAPDNWSFWWRGQRITPATQPAGLVIESVAPDTLVFTDNGQRWHIEVGKFGSR
ncbi:MAG: hypothetical protein AB7G06_06710 [Bdellovibrionales bacterium]